MSADQENRLRSHAVYFDSKISLLPVQVYYPPEETNQEKPNKFMKHKGDQVQKRSVRDKALEAAEAQEERFSSFDPVNLRTVAFVQRLRAQQDSDEDASNSDGNSNENQAVIANKISKKKKQKTAANKKKAEKDGRDEETGSDRVTSVGNKRGAPHLDAESSDDERAPALPKLAAQTISKATTTSTASNSNLSVAEQLRARLHEKIANMKQQRKSEQQEEAARSKAARIAAEIKAGGDGAEKQKKRKADAAGLEDRGQSKTKSSETNSSVVMKPAPAPQSNASSDEQVMSIVLFSSITLGDTKTSEARKKDKKLSDQKLLKKLESFHEKLEGMDEEKKEEILQDKAVHAALLRAQGIKVKDDPKLLRRKLKREEKQKKKSAKAWAERVGAQQAEVKQRQEGRSANVRERQQTIVAKRLKKNKKIRKE